MFDGLLVENLIGKESKPEKKQIEDVVKLNPKCIICKEKFNTKDGRDQHLMDEHGITLQELQDRPNGSLETVRGPNYRRKIP